MTPFTCVKEVPSPNKNARPKGAKIIGVVLHATAGSDKGAVAWMANPVSKASCHIHIDRDGTTVRMVSDDERAWHAGKSEWRGFQDVNGVTLGWEMGNLNNGREPYTDLQYGVVAQMAAHYVRQGLTLDDFVSHEEVARPLGRKNDPLGFDWGRFREEAAQRLGRSSDSSRIPIRVWSDYFRENLIVVRYVNDREWYFVTESQLRALPATRAQTALSQMQEAR